MKQQKSMLNVLEKIQSKVSIENFTIIAEILADMFEFSNPIIIDDAVRVYNNGTSSSYRDFKISEFKPEVPLTNFVEFALRLQKKYRVSEVCKNPLGFTLSSKKDDAVICSVIVSAKETKAQFTSGTAIIDATGISYHPRSQEPVNPPDTMLWTTVDSDAEFVRKNLNKHVNRLYKTAKKSGLLTVD